MQIKLRLVILLTFTLLAACSGNNLDVGSLDAGAPGPAGTGGTATTPTGTGGGGAAGTTLSSDGSDAAVGIDNSGGGPSTCDPLAPVPKSITLGTILGVGQSADGTIYAADQVDDSTQRVFVSDATGTLLRQRGGASGMGSSPDLSEFWVFNASGPDQTFVLEIDKSADGTIRMGVLQGTLTDKKQLVIGQDGEELTVLPSSAIANRPLRNLPGDVTVEYVATTSDGSVLLVTRPTDDWTYADFRLFLGPIDRITEHPVSNVTRYDDGGSTYITFDYNGTPAKASFPIVRGDGGIIIVGAADSLTVGSTTTPLGRLTTPPTGATYVCL